MEYEDDKENVIIRIPKKLLAKIEKQAEQEKRSRNSLIVIALEKVF